MSIIALSYHVFHAKTSRHVSYLRKGKNVAPRRGPGPPRTGIRAKGRRIRSFALDASAPAKYNRNYQKQALRGAAEFTRFSAYFAALCLLLPKSYLENCEQFPFHFLWRMWHTLGNRVNLSRAVSTHSASVVCYDRSGFRARTGVSAKGGKMQRSGKEGHRCQREFRRCGTLSPPCW